MKNTLIEISKSIAFLILMVVLGFTQFGLFNYGYIWATFDSGSRALLVIEFFCNMLLYAGMVAIIFYLCRKWLFGQGKPWLAGFTLLAFLVWWGAISTFIIREIDNFSFKPFFIIGQNKLTEITLKPASLEELEVAMQSPDIFDSLCIQKSEQLDDFRVPVVRSNVNVKVPVESDVFDALVEKIACNPALIGEGTPESNLAYLDAINGKIDQDELKRILTRIERDGTAKEHRWVHFSDQVYIDSNFTRAGDEIGVWMLDNSEGGYYRSVKGLILIDCKTSRYRARVELGYKSAMAKGDAGFSRRYFDEDQSPFEKMDANLDPMVEHYASLCKKGNH